MILQKQKNQSVQCTIQDSSENVCKNINTNKSSSVSKTEKKNAELSSKQNDQSKLIINFLRRNFVNMLFY